MFSPAVTKNDPRLKEQTGETKEKLIIISYVLAVKKKKKRKL